MGRVDYYKELFENAYEPILLIGRELFIDGNKAALKILEMENKEQLRLVHPAQISPKYQPDGELSIEKAQKMISLCYQKGYHQFEWVHKTLSNKNFYVEVTLKRVVIDDETLLHVTFRDLTKEKEIEKDLIRQNRLLEEKNRLIEEVNKILKSDDEKSLFDKLSISEEYKRVLDESAIVSKADINGRIIYVNDKFCEVSGYSREELIGRNHKILRHPDVSSKIYEDLWKTISSKKVFRGIIKNLSKNNRTYYVDSIIMPILDKEDNIVEYISVRHDITSVYEKDAIIHEQYTDSLTKLPNRVKLIHDIQDSIDPKLAIINIDNFKDINGSYDIEVGDNILIEFSNFLKKFESLNIYCYRISGDIFGLFACGNVTVYDLDEVCKDILTSLKEQSFIVRELTIEISITIGIATGCDKLITHAEIAHAYAKQYNKECAIFDKELPVYKDLLNNIKITKDIKYAIKMNKILLYGQKIVNNCDAGRQKYETLMRIETEDKKVLSPFVFLDQAKKAKLYPYLSQMIIEKSCEYFKDKDIEFSINLMIEDIKNEKTVEFLFSKLKEFNVANRVILEIVESEGIEKFKEIDKFIQQAKDLGCKIAIDDFGTGYSNFEYLIRLNIDILKIDGSLIKNIHIDKNVYLTVKTIVNFAKLLDIKVVAEFVHCQEVQEIIKELEIDYSQGYLFHQPELLN